MIFITGFHHSGTTFLTDIVRRMGFSIGKEGEEDRHLEHPKLGEYDESVCSMLVKLAGRTPRWGTCAWTGPFSGTVHMPLLKRKMPDGVQLYKNPRLMVTASTWHENFPDAKWIKIERDWDDVAASMMLEKNRPQDKIFWIELMSEYERRFENFVKEYNPNVLRVSYRRLCHAPDNVLGEIAQFLGVTDFKDAVEWTRDNVKFKTYAQ